MGKQKETASSSYQIKLAKSVHKDIEEIIRYIAFVNEQPLNALRVGDTFEEAFTRIEQNPFAYKECESLRTKSKMYRQAVCLSWLIVYKIIGVEIIILGIIHDARKPSSIKKLTRKN